MKRTRGKHGAGWLNAGAIWAFVLLLLPACGLPNIQLQDPGPTQNLDQGNQPWSSMIMCDIEKLGGRHCPASQAEIDGGIRFSDAAIALAEGRSAMYGVDDTDTGKKNCNGDPEIVEFEGDVFPQGIAVCLNCSQITSMADAIVACRARCYDFHGTTEGTFILPDVPPTTEVKNHCDANARVATNGVFLVNGTDASCYPNMCTTDGISTGAADPRGMAEPVIWTLLSDTAPGGASNNDLTRNAMGMGTYAGAVSQQEITRGDAYVEFSVKDNTQSHYVGLSSMFGCGSSCNADSTDPATIGFALLLGSDGLIYTLEGNLQPTGPGPNYSWGSYEDNERFRITVKDVGDGKAHVTYSRVIGSCIGGAVCTEPIYENTYSLPSYPFRVDTSLREQGATLTNVRLVRIQ